LTAVIPNAATIRRKTYALGGQAVATRVSGDPVSGKNGLFYMHSDHASTSSAHRLGSNSVMSFGQGHGSMGTAVPGSRGRYFPYGGWRVTPTAGLTDQGYTGHKHNNLGSTADDLGLIFMQARYYLPSAGRFISADTIVPDPTNPQQFNRYTYVLNNPLRFTDPTGHCVSSYDPEEQLELLQYCISAVLELHSYYKQLYNDANLMLPFITSLLENAPIEVVLMLLESYGVEPPPNNPLAAQPSFAERMGAQGCLPVSNGSFNCPPEGGWPKYYPWPERYDEEWLRDTTIKMGIKFVAGRFGYFGASRIITNRFGAFVAGLLFNRRITNPIVDYAYDSHSSKRQELSVDANSTISIPEGWNYRISPEYLSRLPSGYYPQPEAYYTRRRR
jgi:RHS repeat-associated protein